MVEQATENRRVPSSNLGPGTFKPCYEQGFNVFTDEKNSRLNKLADWQDPNGDELILGVISQVCRLES